MCMKIHFHMKGYAPRLALKKRYQTTRKWPIHKELNKVLHTLYVPSILPSGWCVRMAWILKYLLEVKVTWGHAHKTIPWTLLGLLTLLQNIWWTHPYLFDWIQLMGNPISIDWFTTGWSLLVSSLPDRVQTILKWFRKRFFFLFFFGARLWQSVTMLIGGIRYSAKANNQTKNKIEIATFPSTTV